MKPRAKALIFYGALSTIMLVVLVFQSDKVSYSPTLPLNLFSASNFELWNRFGRTEENFAEKRENVSIDKNCECISKKTQKSYDFCYKNPKNSSLIGRRFNCSYLKILEDLKLVDAPDQSLVNLANPDRNETIFVSAISDNHFGNFKEMYKLIKQHWPNQKVILYSLELSAIYIKKLKTERNVEVREFDTSKYPKHVKNWAEYRFKALILAEAMRDFPNVWWTDSHNRWNQPKPLAQFYGEIAECMGDIDCDKKSSIFMFVNATHSNYAVLTDGLLDYFPTYGVNTLKYNDKGLQLSAAFVYLARTPLTLDILKWYVGQTQNLKKNLDYFRHTLCALEERCMNPPSAKLKCDRVPQWDRYAGCFRYDQSSLNLLMFNSFRDHNHYFMDAGEVSRTYSHY
ncbi:hypothetical protein CRE_02496 [Caenorhabditis remanei]|uniref:Uncharacterized protein n=1 Tax=Caenorhabditis remanei TaxID=31234 RepID=E3MWV0_CAERE|nr:hypothetical protein CRE_02496 [Caenorhabditis remanei]